MAWKCRVSRSGRQPFRFFKAQVITVWQWPFSTGRSTSSPASSARKHTSILPTAVFTGRVLSFFRS